MKKYQKYIGPLIIMLALISSIITFGIVGPAKTASAIGIQIQNNLHIATSTGLTVLTSSTLVIGTTTQREFLQLFDDSANTIYCALSVQGTASTTFTDGPATVDSGIMITASSSYSFKSDENPYTGPVYCIAAGASAKLTMIQF